MVNSSVDTDGEVMISSVTIGEAVVGPIERGTDGPVGSVDRNIVEVDPPGFNGVTVVTLSATNGGAEVATAAFRSSLCSI